MKILHGCACPAPAGVPLVLGLLCGAFLFLIGNVAVFGQAPESDMVTVQARQVTPHLTAYARVEPVSLLSVSAAESGVITGLKVRPGMEVRAGEPLAKLSGATIASLLVQDEASVRSARAQLDAAQKSLAIEKQQLPSHLTTRQIVQQAESVVAQARSKLVNAQSQLDTAHQLATVPSPTDGIVLQLSSASGALVSAGQPIVTIQPRHGLWLVAQYYGPALSTIRVGMTGEFVPSDGGPHVKIRVVSIPGTLASGGGESIAMDPMQPQPRWLSGQAGTVALDVAPRQMVAVPTRALVLNQGRWWVMVHTSGGDRAQEVVPGPTEGWSTYIVSGLAPGSKVVVNNAYLLYHANVSEHFQIPD